MSFRLLASKMPPSGIKKTRGNTGKVRTCATFVRFVLQLHTFSIFFRFRTLNRREMHFLKQNTNFLVIENWRWNVPSDDDNDWTTEDVGAASINAAQRGDGAEVGLAGAAEPPVVPGAGSEKGFRQKEFIKKLSDVWYFDIASGFFSEYKEG